MGITGLNRYIRSHCKKSTHLIHFSKLEQKKIAVDISIYLYKFESDNALLENMYRMISTFRYYGIIPLFVFDGKPPTEKKALLQERYKKKVDAEQKYKEMETELLSCQLTGDFNESQYELMDSMDKIKKQCVYVNRYKIQNVKDLILAMGCSYVDAMGEADELCVHLVANRGFWACLSEDTDMFVYGCPRVLRYLSLINHTAVLYDMDSILKELQMNQKEFRHVCVFSGTDYSPKEPHTIVSIEKVFQYFKEYEKSKIGKEDFMFVDFYTWLNKMNIIDFHTMLDLEKINTMFDLSYKSRFILEFPLSENNTQALSNHLIKKELVRYLLYETGFIFYDDSCTSN